MRYFFIAYLVLVTLLVGALGLRGDKFSKPPIRLFPDMDEMDKVRSQEKSVFFTDTMGGRLPLAGTQPFGYDDQASDDASQSDLTFSGLEGYYNTGHIGDYYGSGMPAELAGSGIELLKRGEERYNIYCAICHSKNGNGQSSVPSQYGIPGVANLHQFLEADYPNGRLFEVISHGKGNMGGYAYQLPIKDRWAIIAYVRALQIAKQAPLSQPAVKQAVEAAASSK